MNEGDFVRINYVGRIKESKEIFDLTKEDVAKEKGIFNPDFKYGPVPVIIGSSMIIKGVEKILKEMKVGEKRDIVVSHEDGFGKRSEKLIKLIPIVEFRRQNMDPYPGMIINMNNLSGRVLSVSGGRITVDFNHPLAGKELEYDLEIMEEIKEKDKQVKAILELYIKMKDDDAEVSVKDNVAEIKLKIDMPRKAKEEFVQTVKKWVKEIDKIRFIEEI